MKSSMQGTRFSQSLLLTAIISSTALVGCSDSDSDKNVGDNEAAFTVSGTAVDFYTGERVDRASISVAGVINDVNTELGETTTNGNGQFSFSYDVIPTRLVITGESDEYGEYSIIIQNDDQESRVAAGNLALQPVDVDADFDPTTDSTIELNNTAVIELTANSLVDSNGNAPEGDVSGRLTIIDPSNDPSLMPGNYQTINDQGGISLIESFGAISAVFEDSTGQELNLAENQTATIRIPLASGVNPNTADATIPLFYFDETTGFWVEEGTATLTQLANNTYVYEGTVSHFTVWNADKVYETININGCIVNEAGEPVGNANVTSQGVDYIGSANTTSTTDGLFSLPARFNSEVLVSARNGAISNTLEVNTGNTDADITNNCLVLSPDAVNISLTWGEHPDDLDSHLFGPANAEGTEQFHVYYGNHPVTVNGVVMDLDVDDTNSFGPEVISIPRFPYPGTYQYLVHKYSGESDIVSSPARVKLTIGEEETFFSPTEATNQLTEEWAVFNIEVDANLNPTVVSVQNFVEGIVEGDEEGEIIEEGFEAFAVPANTRTHKPGSTPSIKPSYK